jgi:hypothetical protein
MISQFYKALKFHILHLRLCWLRAKFESKNGHKPYRLHLNGEVFDFMYIYISTYGFFENLNFEYVYEDVFGVPSLSRSNGIKFARYE